MMNIRNGDEEKLLDTRTIKL